MLLALSGGVGVVLYVAGWLLLPADGRDTAPVDDMFGATPQWPREVWIAIVAIACVQLRALRLADPLRLRAGRGPRSDLVLRLLQDAVKQSARPPRRPPPANQPAARRPPFRYPGPPTPFTEAAEAWQRRMDEYQATQGRPSPVPPGLARPRATSPRPGPAPAAPARSGRRPDPVADPEQLQRAAFLATPDPVGLYAEPTGSSVRGAAGRPGGDRRPAVCAGRRCWRWG